MGPDYLSLKNELPGAFRRPDERSVAPSSDACNNKVMPVAVIRIVGVSTDEGWNGNKDGGQIQS